MSKIHILANMHKYYMALNLYFLEEKKYYKRKLCCSQAFLIQNMMEQYISYRNIYSFLFS